MQTEDQELIKTLKIDSITQYKLKPGDVLGIEVSNSGVAGSPVFNDKIEGGKDPGSSENISSKGFVIDSEGNIEIPLVGKVYVNNKTLTEVNTELKKILSEYLNYAYVKVFLLSFKITVIGEVRMPGNYPVMYTSLNLFEALAMAGDVTEYGNRKCIKIIRKEKDQYTVITLDLSREDVITNNHFSIQPDDIIYVEPLKAKVLKTNTSNVTIFVSIVSAVVLLITLTRRI